jgi:hypothetical protein
MLAVSSVNAINCAGVSLPCVTANTQSRLIAAVADLTAVAPIELRETILASPFSSSVSGKCVALISAVAAGLLGGCATGQDVTTGSLLPSSGYLLSASEKNWHCAGLENALQARVTAIAALNVQARKNADSGAPTVSALFARMFGKPGDDNPALAQIRTERTAADAYNDALKAKGCAAVDIDAKIATANGQSAI